MNNKADDASEISRKAFKRYVCSTGVYISSLIVNYCCTKYLMLLINMIYLHSSIPWHAHIRFYLYLLIEKFTF